MSTVSATVQCLGSLEFCQSLVTVQKMMLVPECLSQCQQLLVHFRRSHGTSGTSLWCSVFQGTPGRVTQLIACWCG